MKDKKRWIQKIADKPIEIIKTPKQKWAKNSWIFSIVAGIVGFASLLTPFSSEKWIDGAGVLIFSFEQWWFGFNITYQHPLGYDSFWTGNPFYLIPEIITFIGIILSNFTILLIAARLPKKEKNASKGLIGGAIGLLISSIALIAILELLYVIRLGYPYWQRMSPGFALIWQFIGSALVLIGFFLGKSSSRPTNLWLFSINL